MENSFNQNPYGGSPAVPPPPPEESGGAAVTEISIRTMASDLETLGLTGGATPGGRTVSISFGASGKDGKRKVIVKDANEVSNTPETKGSNIIIWSLGGTLLAIALFLIGYFFIPRLFTGSQSPSSDNSSNGPGETRPRPGLPTSTVGTVFLGHESFFNLPPDDIVAVRIGSVLGDGGPENYASRSLAAISANRSQDSFFELALAKADGRPPAWTEFLASENIELLTAEFFADKFEQDFTAFAYRDKRGVWPGYILKIKRGISPLALRSEVQVIEGDVPRIVEFFFSPPGKAAGGFKEGQIAGQPMRFLSFGTSSAIFGYGWFFNSYLIFGTSEEGFREAVRRL